MDLVQNVGYELIPSAPSGGTGVVAGAAADTFGSWAQLVASLTDDNYLVGLAATEGIGGGHGGGVTYIDVQVGVGAVGSEVAVSSVPVACNPDAVAGLGLQSVVMLDDPVFLTTGSRVSARVADTGGGRTHKVALMVVQQANVLTGPDAYIVRTQMVLAQVSPTANTVTDLFTASGTQGIDAVRISNSNLTSVEVSVSFAPGGAADAMSQYLYSNVLIGSSQTITLPLAIAAVSGDKVRVKATATGVGFTLLSS